MMMLCNRTHAKTEEDACSTVGVAVLCLTDEISRAVIFVDHATKSVDVEPFR